MRSEKAISSFAEYTIVLRRLYDCKPDSEEVWVGIGHTVVITVLFLQLSLHLDKKRYPVLRRISCSHVAASS